MPGQCALSEDARNSSQNGAGGGADLASIADRADSVAVGRRDGLQADLEAAGGGLPSETQIWPNTPQVAL